MAGVGDRVRGQSEVRLGDQRFALLVEDAEVPRVSEGIGVRQVPADEILAADIAVRGALIETMRPRAEAEPPVYQLLEHRPQRTLVIDQVVAGVFGGSHSEADLR